MWSWGKAEEEVTKWYATNSKIFNFSQCPCWESECPIKQKTEFSFGSDATQW